MRKKDKSKQEEIAGEEKASGRKLSKKLLVIPVVLLAAAVLAGYTFISRGTERRIGPSEPAASSAAASGSGTSSAASSGVPDQSDASSPQAEGSQTAPLRAAPAQKTVPESVDYIRSLSPAKLGLEGDSMDSYEIIPEGSVVLVDGMQCTEVFVYRVDEETGTNCFMGSYLLSRADNRLYSLDQDTGIVTLVDL